MTCRESKTAPRRSGIPIVEERSISVTARGGQVFVYCLAYDGLDTVNDVDTVFSLFDATAVEVEDHGATAASVHAVHGVGGFNHLEVLDFPSGGAFRRAGVLEAELHLLARVGFEVVLVSFDVVPILTGGPLLQVEGLPFARFAFRGCRNLGSKRRFL